MLPMNCLTEDQVLAFLAPDGAVERGEIEHHLDGCAECMELVTLASQTSFAVRAQGSAGFVPGTPSRELARGTRVGRYEILEPRGRGAMGTVYAARDTQLDRDVAIKLVDPGPGGDDRAQVGLLREAKALARVTHPNVLTVYEFGTFEHDVYLAAELVEGETLAVWGARPRPWRAVVAVYLDAARGLVAAHAAGLVHRDFKPTNVLIGTDGRVRVCDFGLARFTELATSARELVGTPIYMAPEQRRGEVADARSDQYAFCVALHEALFGFHPDRRPANPDRTCVPRWLSAIVARGLEAEPDRRFPSMSALVAATERGLGRRRRWIGGGLATGAVAVAAVTMLVGYRHGARELEGRCPVPALASWNPARETTLAQAFAASKMPYGPALWTRTDHVLGTFATRLGAQRREACLAFDVHHTEDAALHDRRETCLDQARIMFESILDRLAEPMGDRLLPGTTSLVSALPDLDACVRPRETEIVAPADRAAHDAFFVELSRVASLSLAGRIDEATRGVAALTKTAQVLGSKRAQAYVKYIEGQLAMIRGQHAEAAKAFEAALWSAEAAGHDELVSSAAADLVQALVGSGRDVDAQRFRELALAAAERVGSISARASVARSIGHSDTVAGRFDSAEHLLERALELEESRVPPDDYDIATVLLDLGDLHYRRGQLAKAEPLDRRAILLLSRTVGPAHPANGSALNNLANVVADLGRSDEARELYARSLAMREAALGPDHPEIAQTLNNAAGLAVQAGKFDDARRDLERSLAIYAKHADVSPIAVASVVHNLGEIAMVQGRFDDAKQLHLRALELRRKTAGEHHPTVAESQLALATIAFAQRDLAAARTWCSAARATVAGSDANNAELLAAVETCEGLLELETGHADRAVPILERAAARDFDPGEKAVTQFALARALPLGPKAVALARVARAAFEREGAYRARELAEAAVWLRANAH